MIEKIIKETAGDAHLAYLLGKTREYAQVYLFAKARQKGCDGMGEVATLKDEFKSIVDELIAYCKTKGYLQEDVLYDIDLVADEFVSMPKKQTLTNNTSEYKNKSDKQR
jgi:hypothetical protein